MVPDLLLEIREGDEEVCCLRGKWWGSMPCDLLSNPMLAGKSRKFHVPTGHLCIVGLPVKGV
jgi:hypothetical protein